MSARAVFAVARALGVVFMARLNVKLDMQRAALNADKEMTLSTDYPDAGRAVS
jgi:hypothetical protein